MGEPFTYAYRYPAFPPEGATVIRFNHGEEVNGSKPIEAIPLYTRPSPSEDDVERVARALAIKKGRAKGECDCRMCRRAVHGEVKNARAALSALPQPEATEGLPFNAPARIWLFMDSGGDVVWCNNPDPDGDAREGQAVEYQRLAMQARTPDDGDEG